MTSAILEEKKLSPSVRPCSHFADCGTPPCLTLSASLLAMEEAALNRLATSITRLTLSQVTTDEVDAATKLLDKACQERGIPDVPPQRITDLETASTTSIKLHFGQLHNCCQLRS